MRYRKRSQPSIYTDVKSNSIQYIYDDCDSVRRSTRWNTLQNSRLNVKRDHKSRPDTEYIELESTDIRNSNKSTEPLYIPILPPT